MSDLTFPRPRPPSTGDMHMYFEILYVGPGTSNQQNSELMLMILWHGIRYQKPSIRYLYMQAVEHEKQICTNILQTAAQKVNFSLSLPLHSKSFNQRLPNCYSVQRILTTGLSLLTMRDHSPSMHFMQFLMILSFYLSTMSAVQPAPYRAGKFTNAAITDLAQKLGGEMGGHLEWFADTVELFSFPGHDGLPLQGYHIPAKSDSSKSNVDDSNHATVPLPVIIHCAGWSESTIKYSKFLRILHGQGYAIYSFDMRGQGFSSSTGCHRISPNC